MNEEYTTTIELYKEWLYEKIGFGDSVEKYYGLLGLLFDMKFFAMMSMDENRALDGKDLRWLFAEETGVCTHEELDILMGNECRIIEMLIALARKIATKIIGETYKGDRTPDWFWRFIKNLGLENCYGEYLPIEFRVNAMAKLSRWMSRDIDYDGSGGLFPLKNPPGDERKTEIIYQMYAYIHENFPV